MHRLVPLLMKLVVVLVIIIKKKMSRLKFFATLFISLFFCNATYSKGPSFDKQKSLIDSGSISVGMNCNNLSNALGGINNLSWLPLGNKEGKYAHFVLLDVYSKDLNKIHYLCEQKRFEYVSNVASNNIVSNVDPLVFSDSRDCDSLNNILSCSYTS